MQSVYPYCIRSISIRSMFAYSLIAELPDCFFHFVYLTILLLLLFVITASFSSHLEPRVYLKLLLYPAQTPHCWIILGMFLDVCVPQSNPFQIDIHF